MTDCTVPKHVCVQLLYGPSISLKRIWSEDRRRSWLNGNNWAQLSRIPLIVDYSGIICQQEQVGCAVILAWTTGRYISKIKEKWWHMIKQSTCADKVFRTFHFSSSKLRIQRNTRTMSGVQAKTESIHWVQIQNPCSQIIRQRYKITRQD